MTGTVDITLGPIAALCDGEVSFKEEGGRKFISMEKLRFRVGATARVMDALLCLNYENASYPTKLYVPENLGGEGINWNETAYHFGRNWCTFSWSGVSPDQPYLEILAEHLAPLSRGRAA